MEPVQPGMEDNEVTSARVPHGGGGRASVETEFMDPGDMTPSQNLYDPAESIPEIIAKECIAPWEPSEADCARAHGGWYMPFESRYYGMLYEGLTAAGKDGLVKGAPDAFKGGGNVFDLAAEVERCHTFGNQINK